MAAGVPEHFLRPLACLLPTAEQNSALVILNRPLEKPLLEQLWKCSLYKAVADGGINRLCECLEEKEGEHYIPDVIAGDFDSAVKENVEVFREKGVAVVNTPDQDETDFTKCLRVAIEKTSSLPVQQYLVMGSIGGRLDHHYANLATLFTAARLTPKPVYLISKGNLACLLPPGRTTIVANTGYEDKYCGLIPIGGSCEHVTTSGLKWNLYNQTLAFGGLISTSNAYNEGVVTVNTDKPLLWTMTYNFDGSSV